MSSYLIEDNASRKGFWSSIFPLKIVMLEQRDPHTMVQEFLIYAKNLASSQRAFVWGQEFFEYPHKILRYKFPLDHTDDHVKIQ